MKVTGIIVEYNPFHHGHEYHIQKTRELTQCDVLIAVMSGNFVQRGEPAILDKWQRAQVAIQHGVDLVIELPYIYATQSATNFAKGAIQLLALAQVDELVFGSETNNIEELKEMADSCINADNLKESMRSGHSFPKAYGLLAKEMGPNDILGVSYLKELKHTSIVAHTIQRTVHYHDEEIHNEVASATAIRKAVHDKKSFGHTTCMSDALNHGPTVSIQDFYSTLRLLLTTLPPSVIASIFLVSEGIENHLIKQAHLSATYDQFIQNAVTRRYTTSRIRRCCLQILNHITKDEAKNCGPLDTLRILAFNDKGRDYLKHLQKAEVNIASKFSQVPTTYRKMEYKTTLLYASALSEEKRQELLQKEIGSPIYIKKGTGL